MPSPFKALRQRTVTFWNEDRSLSALLTLLVLQIFVFAHLPLERYPLLNIANSMLWSCFLLAGLLTTAKHLMARWLLSVLVAAAITMRWLAVSVPMQPLLVADSLLFLCTAICFTAAVLRKVYASGRITRHRVRGAIAAYLLFGFTFAAAYRLLYMLLPDALSTNSTLAPWGEEMEGIFMYFSFVTLTTVGFGDVTAVHPLARSLVILESLIGTLYPAILLARLVSLQLEQEKE